MSVGFRKSLLGFNCEDVMSYIEKSHQAFSKKEKDFKEKIEELDGVIKNVNCELENIKNAKAEVEAELKAYTDKREEIERLSQNIGKLYLVAQSNAQAVMKNSDESRALAESEIARNLDSIDAAHQSLDDIKEKVLKTSNDFIGQVEELLNSLNETKEIIEQKKVSSEEHAASFENLYSQIVK
ncbi:MAG: hypothetical protein IJN15_02710 [Clostridia bacterium]|nr:hypothetical protein [Clostridia bacterium]